MNEMQKHVIKNCYDCPMIVTNPDSMFTVFGYMDAYSCNHPVKQAFERLEIGDLSIRVHEDCPLRENPILIIIETNEK